MRMSTHPFQKDQINQASKVYIFITDNQEIKQQSKYIVVCGNINENGWHSKTRKLTKQSTVKQDMLRIVTK